MDEMEKIEDDVSQYMFNEEFRSEGTSLKCPSCGSPLMFDPNTQKFSCEVCGSAFSKEEVEDKTLVLNQEDEVFDEVVKEYSCPSCGAEIMTDETTTTEFCAYCGNPVILKGRVNGEIKPNLIIPFSISKEEAKKLIFKHLKRYGFVPNSFHEEANLDKIQGIYYPFWESDIDTDSSLTAECTKTTTWTSGDKRYTKTSYYNVYRKGDIHFEDISVIALKSADKKLVEGVLPFPIKDHIKFDMAYLTGFYAKKFDLTYDEVRAEVKHKLNEYSERVLQNTISGYGSVKVKSHNNHVKNIRKDYTFLPVWILNYKYGEKNYTFAINGVTGKLFGDLPISKWKLTFAFFGFLIGLFILIAFLGGLIL